MTPYYQDDAVTKRERRDWLTARIEAKVSVGWDVVWDVREQRALAWAVRQEAA